MPRFLSRQEHGARGLLQQCRGLPVGEAGLAKLAIGVVAGQDEQEVERPLLREAGSQSVGSPEVVDESVVFAAAVGSLAVDECLRSRVDRRDAVELSQDRVLG